MIWSSLQVIQSNTTFNGLLFLTSAYWYNLAYPQFLSVRKIASFGSKFVNFVLFFTLASRWVMAGYFPLSNLYESLLFLTWILLTIQIIAESKTQSKIIGSIITPICLLIMSFSTLILPLDMQTASPLVPALQSNWLMMHVSMMMVSYATLILGSLFSVLFLILSSSNQTGIAMAQTGQQRKLRAVQLNRYRSKLRKAFTISNQKLRTIGYFVFFMQIKRMKKQSTFYKKEIFYLWCGEIIQSISRLKLLNNIDIWSYRTIGLGFPFLTIGIISGAVWANESWGSYWSWDPKETWALITWLIFASYLHTRITKKGEGIKTALVGTLGFFVIWICYLGVNFLGRGLHSYGWLS